jgi:alpha-tubulin suppressor-like RCC1 family protein
MPIVSRLAAMTSRAWGQFKTGAISLAGNYLYFWGANTTSRLGNGLVTATVARSSPIAVAINKTIVTGDAASNTMVIDSSGQLWVWGPQSQSLGIGITTGARNSPVQVGALTDWAKIRVGPSWAYAVKTDGTYWGWGVNPGGLLGTSNTITYSSPVQIGADTNWSEVNGRQSTTVAIKTDGTLYAWGLNQTGAVGDGTTINRSSPVQIGTLTNWYQASATLNIGAVKTDGTLWVWGRADSGQLGNGTTTPNRSSPIQVGTLTNWAQISAGTQYFVAIKTDGTLWAWGLNTSGELGDGTTVNKSSPVQIGTLTNWAYIDTYLNQTVARKTDGTLWVWGLQNGTQFGTGNNTIYSSPVQVGTRTDYTFVAMGASSSLYLTSDGFTWQGGCSGNSSGQVGVTIYSSPVALSTLTRKYASASATSSTVTAVSTDGTLWSWGGNTFGEIGDGTTEVRSLPTQIGTLTNWASVWQTSVSTPVAVKQDGTIWSWGGNTNGTLGDGSWGTANQLLDYPVPFTDRQYSDMSYGTAAYFVSNGALYACGNNNFQEVGNGTTVWASSPVQIGTQTNWSKVAAGDQYGLAIKTDGTLWSWGVRAGYVQGPEVTNLSGTSSFSSPVLIPITFGKLPNACSFDNTLAISRDNYLFGWGRNGEAELGLGDLIKVAGPKMIGTLTWSEVTGGGKTSAAIRYDNTLWAWGENGLGELGLGNTTNRLSPVQVGTLADYSKVVCGPNSTYFVRNGTLWATGQNNLGQLGDGTTTNRSSPVQIGTLNTWSKVFATQDRTAFAIKTDGTLWAWGSNAYGQIGDNTSTNRSSPVQVGTLTNWATVSNGGYGALAVKTDGTLWAWGWGQDGQLGDGSIISKSSPVQVGTLTNWSKASLGASHAVAVKTDGTIWSWGTGSFGQLGTGSTVLVNSPVQIGTLTNWSEVVAINTRSFFLNTSGQVWACGDNVVNTAGAPYPGLGVDTNVTVPVPIQVGTLSTWSEVSAGGDSNLLLKNDGTLWSAGDNQYGASGNGSTVANYTLRQVGTLTNWSKVAGTFGSSFAIKADGTLWSWGLNRDGVLGLGDTTNRSSPVQVGTLSNWSRIRLAVVADSPESTRSLAINSVKTDGTLWAWGRNDYGQLGLNDTTSRSSPVQVGTLTDWAYSFGNKWNSYFVKTDNTLWAVGANNAGQLGNGTTVNQSSPIQIGTGYSGLLAGASDKNTGPVTAVVAAQKTDNTIASWGYGYTGPSTNGNVPPAYIYTVSVSSPVQVGTLSDWSSSRLKTDGTLWGWGLNSSGQIGDGTTITKISPVQVGTLNTWAYAIQNNVSHFTAAIRTNNTLWMWGANGSGQLGQGNTTSRSSPVQVGTLSNWSKVAVGNSFTLSVKTDGTLWAWGINSSGQLGLGNTTARSSPIQIGASTDWADVWTGISTSYAVKTDGTLWAWGANTSGQMGDGTITNKSSPVQIGALNTWANGVNTASGYAGAFSTV